MPWRSQQGWPRWHQLDRYGRDITRNPPARQEPLVENRDLSCRLAAALLCSLGGNAALVGPTGAGKRSALKAFVQSIVHQQAPEELNSRQVFWVDLTRLAAGARYRGELEDRARSLGAEVAAGRGRLVVVLENTDALLRDDPESGQGGFALRTLLLAGGCLLSLTPEQAARLAQSTPDWAALVQTVEMPEWSDDACEVVLDSHLPELRAHHRLDFAPDVARVAVQLARRHVPAQALPSAALQIMDHAAAIARLGGGGEVGRGQLLEAVAVRTGLPLSGLNTLLPGQDLEDRWLRAEEVLARRVVGQEPAVRSVAAALRRARTGLGDPRRPLGSFLFVGPTGVGKTELGRALAEFLFGDEEALIRVDMSEYMERHSVARLIGAPPGYVGFGLPGQLTDPVLRRPFSVVLMDEVEKAHPDVLNLLLQVLEDGRLTDGYGRVVDFRHTVVALTSNAGSHEAVGAGARARDVYRDYVQRLFRPELLNRLDDVILFSPLSAESMEDVVELQMERSRHRLAVWGVDVHLTPAARHALARAGYQPELGARPLRRLIEREVLDAVARALLAGALSPGTSVVLDGAPGEWQWQQHTPDDLREARFPA